MTRVAAAAVLIYASLVTALIYRAVGAVLDWLPR